MDHSAKLAMNGGSSGITTARKAEIEACRIVFTNLRLLGFQSKRYVSTQALDKLDLNLMHEIMYFLLTKLDPERSKKEFEVCWPVSDGEQRIMFREVASNWISQLQANKHLPPGLFKKAMLSSAGKGVIIFLWKLSNLVIEAEIERCDPSGRGKVVKRTKNSLNETLRKGSSMLNSELKSVLHSHLLIQANRFMSQCKGHSKIHQKWIEYATKMSQQFVDLHDQMEVFKSTDLDWDSSDLNFLKKALTQLEDNLNSCLSLFDRVEQCVEAEGDSGLEWANIQSSINPGARSSAFSTDLAFSMYDWNVHLDEILDHLKSKDIKRDVNRLDTLNREIRRIESELKDIQITMDENLSESDKIKKVATHLMEEAASKSTLSRLMSHSKFNGGELNPVENHPYLGLTPLISKNRSALTKKQEVGEPEPM